MFLNCVNLGAGILMDPERFSGPLQFLSTVVGLSLQNRTVIGQQAEQLIEATPWEARVWLCPASAL